MSSYRLLARHCIWMLLYGLVFVISHKMGKVGKPALKSKHTNRSSSRARDTCGRAPLNKIATTGRAAERIIFGYDQHYGDWPSFVGLISKTSLNIITCGGVLVSNRHVITAGHCVTEDGKRKVRPGAIKLHFAVHRLNHDEEFERTARVKSVCIAKKYTFHGGRAFKDWALLELTEPIQFNDHIQPACLPRFPIKTQGNDSVCYVMGVGLNGPEETSYPEVVQFLRVKQVPCVIPPDGPNVVDCYENNNLLRRVCSGDSGSPVLCLDDAKRWTVVAVASQSFPCNIFFLPGFAHYTSLKYLSSEIEEQCGAIQ